MDAKEAKNFLKENHIQGWCISTDRLGLYYNNELVSLMTFGVRKISGKSQLELLRFCNKLYTTVVGGASKLFSHYVKMNDTLNIISYADRCWSIGTMYEKLGFTKIKNTPPNYWWGIQSTRYNRLQFTKDKLYKLGWLLKDETEAECMHRLGYYRIYDAGSIVYQYIK